MGYHHFRHSDAAEAVVTSESFARTQWIVQKTEVVAGEAIVAAMHPHAAEAGAAMLRAGGNAVDAAVAAAFASGVVEPFNSGLGGIAQVLYYEARSGRSFTVDGLPPLPRGIRPDTFRVLDSGTRSGLYSWPAVADDANNTGYLAPAVPGTPACLGEALARFGRLPLATVIEPAAQLAEQGFELDWYVALATACAQGRLQRFPETRRVYFKPDGSCYRAAMLGAEADRFAQPDLARTLRHIAEHGTDAVYRGEIAARIAADMAANGGLITADDLASFRARVHEPGIVGHYRDCELRLTPANTGGPTLLEALNVLEGFDLARTGFNRVETLHLIAEALRVAFADRFRYLGDPESTSVSLAALLSKSYAGERRQSIRLDQATPEAGPGDPGVLGVMGGLSVPTTPGVSGEGQTTHITVVDRERNVVSLTSTLGGHFGSGVVVGGTGILLNNGAMWFDPVPGSANSIAPGRRILWAGTPALVLRHGQPLFAVGAPGGRKIISAVLQSILNVVDFGLGAQDAVSAPRVHCEGVETLVDTRLGASVAEGLRRLGHRVTAKEEDFSTSYFARPNGVLIDLDTGRLRGGVNQYKPALAVGL